MLTPTTLPEAVAKHQERRRRPARAIKRPDDLERYYRAQLFSLIRAMDKAVKAEVMPVIKQERDEYTADALLTNDNWASRIIAAINRVADRFINQFINRQYERIGREFVGRANQQTTREVVQSVNRAVGVDITPMLSDRDMADYIEMSIEQNVQLIKSVPQQYFERMRSVIYEGTRAGVYPSNLAEQVQAETGVSYRRAKVIVRDQTSKITGQIAQRRQEQAGIKHYRVSTANDERVSGAPGGRYPNAKISCYGIARQDIGFGPGVYTWKDGAEWNGVTRLHPGNHHVGCRCTGTPVFEWELPDKK